MAVSITLLIKFLTIHPEKTENDHKLMAKLNWSFGSEKNYTSAEYQLPPNIFVVELIPTYNPRAKTDDCTAAKMIEMNGLNTQRLWGVVQEMDVDSNSVVIGGRFVLTLKNYDTPAEKT